MNGGDMPFSSSLDAEPVPLSLAQMVIGSVDTLRGKELDLSIPNTWNDRPPLLQGRRGAEETPLLLKGMLRKGVPPALRCAVWLSNVIQAVHPHEEAQYWHEYRTLSRVRALDHAYDSLLCLVAGGKASSDLSSSAGGSDGGNSQHSSNHSSHKSVTQQKQQQPNLSDEVWSTMDAPTFGQRADAPSIPDMTPAGRLVLKRVLMALERILVGVDHAPMLPTLTALLLTTMSESYAFCAVREMSHNVNWYFPVSIREQKAWCLTLCDVLRKLHKTTYSYLEDRGVMDDLSPIFQDLFIGILPVEHVLRIMDLYTLEGGKVLFRFGVAVFVLFKMFSSENLLTLSNADEWWAGLRAWAHSDQLDFDYVVRKAYGVHGKGIRGQMRFPGRQILQRIIRLEEERLYEEEGEEEGYAPAPARPLGMAPPRLANDTEEAAKPILADSTKCRLQLAEWLPLTLRMTNLELLYSTNHHGRSLEMFYNRVKRAKHTILLCESYPAAANQHAASPSSSSSSESMAIIGVYASQAWRASPEVYGDGSCFLFRLEPNAACWKWKPTRPQKAGESLLDSVNLEDHGSNNQTALLEQFMVGTKSFISMGGNQDGSAGLRLNEDFTVGESSTAKGFENESLHGQQSGSVFDIGLVEVYGLVRQIDGRAA